MNEDILGVPLLATAFSGGLLYSAGTVLFGDAVRRSGVPPRWAGALYAPTGFLISVAGLMVGRAQTLRSTLFVIATARISWRAVLRSSAGMSGVGARPGAQ